MALSHAQVQAAKPAEKAARLYDGGGMYLEVSPAGGKLWRLKYRFAGKEKRLALGTYPDTGLAKARQKRDDARKLLAAGIDPSADRKAQALHQRAHAVTTFEGVARAWLTHRADAWVERTRSVILASLVNDAFPALGQRPIAEIQPADIRAVVQGIEARGAGETASRVFQRLRAIFRYAVAHDLIVVDPTYPLKPAEIFKPRRVQHRKALTERELPTFLDRLNAYGGDPVTIAALRLLLLTALRPGELRGGRWDEIDTERSLWRIPAPRMKMKIEHIVPLSPAALSVIEALRPISGSGPLLLPSPYYPGKSISDATLNSALARMGYKGSATAHGFRTLFSTCANEAGWNRDVIEKQLAHDDRNQVRKAYNRAMWLEERRVLLNWWAGITRDAAIQSSSSLSTARSCRG